MDGFLKAAAGMAQQASAPPAPPKESSFMEKVQNKVAEKAAQQVVGNMLGTGGQAAASSSAGGAGALGALGGAAGLMGLMGGLNKVDAQQAHAEVYNQGTPGVPEAHHDESTVGAAAAMQAFKMFQGSGAGAGDAAGGGDAKAKMVQMAMSQASTLLQNKPNTGADGGMDKQKVLMMAGAAAMKMFAGQQGGQQGGQQAAEAPAHASTGGLDLMHMASKFM